ncbi:MAG: vacuolar-sorting receptor 1-like isoform 1, partial [Trebouxia sp. A1-2]
MAKQLLHSAKLLCSLIAIAINLRLSMAGEWIVETHSLVIRAPATIAGVEDAAIGDFGVPMYGASMLGELVRSTDNSLACEQFQNVVVQPVHGLPPVLLAERGGCYFIEKAYNAEKAGFKGILIYDNTVERLLTMAAPEDRPEIAKLANDINIPTALLTQATGQKLADTLKNGDSVVVELDFKESMAHPDDRVEWEFWTSSNDACGSSCDRQSRFKLDFAETAIDLEQRGYTQFKPHFMVQKCLDSSSSQTCQDNCVNNGRYCAMDSIPDSLQSSYNGRQVVEENKRQLCIRQQAESKHQAWLWWTYVQLFTTHCKMQDRTFDSACAQQQIQATNLSLTAIEDCMGSSDADANHPLLQAEYDAQGTESIGEAAGRVVLLPTVIINNKQYRGRLDSVSITKALCAGFDETTEPEVCLTGNIQENNCAVDSQTCWSDDSMHLDACVDTYRGYVCKCPDGWRGNGQQCSDINECLEGTAGCDHTCINEIGSYHCECDEGFNLFGGQGTPGFCYPKDMCGKDNGGCEGPCYSANGTSVCSCGAGLRLADNGKTCVDIDECAEHLADCTQQCNNKDPRKSGVPYSCSCDLGFSLNLEDRHQCVKTSEFLSQMGVSFKAASWWSLAAASGAAAVLAILAGYAIQRFRIRQEMHEEIHEIMRQYMPLSSAEDAHVSETHKIASFKPASLSPNRETFVGQGENQA